MRRIIDHILRIVESVDVKIDLDPIVIWHRAKNLLGINLETRKPRKPVEVNGRAQMDSSWFPGFQIGLS